jgi:hypothetical protein
MQKKMPAPGKEEEKPRTCDLRVMSGEAKDTLNAYLN